MTLSDAKITKPNNGDYRAKYRKTIAELIKSQELVNDQKEHIEDITADRERYLNLYMTEREMNEEAQKELTIYKNASGAIIVGLMIVLLWLVGIV